MKILALLLPVLTSAATRHPPHILPDAPSSAYSALLPPSLLSAANGDGLDPVVSLGERNIAWLLHINASRPPEQRLSFTSKETQRGIPIDRPSEYNVELIGRKLETVRGAFPEPMRRVIFEGQPFSAEPPVAVEAYLRHSRELDRVYQSALRWRMMQPWLSWLAGRRHQDLRGWYYLSRFPNRAHHLRKLRKLPGFLQQQIREWFVNLCFNSDPSDELSVCEREIDSWIAEKRNLEEYFQKQAPLSERMYRGYFDIPAGVARPEPRWLAGPPARLIAPFTDPGSEELRSFLRVNIEDEWRFGDWKLELPFTRQDEAPHVEFRHNVTPHVNGLGGDTIVMNADQPLTEYDAQWTIRHEYGHVLGFPDCYVEFYEPERNVIVNYQFDTDNLMCSRRGHIQEIHVQELKRVYGNRK